MTLNRSLLIPLVVFLLLVLILASGFWLKDPHYLPSELINKPFPAFELQDLHENRTLTTQDLGSTVSLVNVWATWCPNCLVEHPELMRIAKEENIPLYGVNYNDDTEKAIRWLERHGNPFRFSVVDDKGTLAIDLGVYGAPETFVVDQDRVIRFRHVGPLNEEIWERELEPVVRLLREQAKAAP